MYGRLMDAIAYTIRDYPSYHKFGLNVIKGNNTDGRIKVNTTLPVVVITPLDSTEPTTFIGGKILEKITIEISVVTELINYSISDDMGVQSEMTDMCYDLLSYLENQMSLYENNPYFSCLRDYNFNSLYNGFRTYTSVAAINNSQIDIQVFSYRFSMNVLRPDKVCGSKPKDVPLKEVDLLHYDTDLTTGKKADNPQTTKITKKSKNGKSK